MTHTNHLHVTLTDGAAWIVSPFQKESEGEAQRQMVDVERNWIPLSRWMLQ